MPTFPEMKAKEEDKVEEVIADLEVYANTLSSDSRGYFAFHRERYRWTAELILARMRDREPDFRLLDLGNSFQTMLMERLFPSATIETLGFHDERYALSRLSKHYQYDLNLAYERSTWPEPTAPFDLITFFEVIEHLHVSPHHVLAQLYSYLRPNGLLIVSTPNAASAQRRRSLLMGRNPYEAPRLNHHLDPGHIREYTQRELLDYGREAGFAVDAAYLHDPYTMGPRYDRFYYRLLRRWFPTLRNSQTCVFRRQARGDF
jgi:SAM-dependent methyltransferase